MLTEPEVVREPPASLGTFTVWHVSSAMATFADVKSLLPVVEKLRNRFGIERFCIVADRSMISADTIAAPELPDCRIPYILGARMRQVKEVSDEALSRAGHSREVNPETKKAKACAPLAAKEVVVEDRRYIVCRNTRQARKDAAERQTMVEALEERLGSNPKGLVGNRGCARYLKLSKGAMTIDREKLEEEARFDGKWVLRTNIDLPAEKVALKYKELWQVEQVFRDMTSVLDTRPIFHKRDETIRGHVFCSFLALVLRKELDRRLEKADRQLEWEEIKRDLKALQRVTMEEDGRRLAV